MEALLVIFAEILFALLAPLLAAIGAFIALIFEAFLLLLAALFGSSGGSAKPRKKQRSKAPSGQSEVSDWKATPSKLLISRKSFHWVVGGFGAAAVAFVLATVVFFDPLLRMVLTKGAERAGMEVTYEDSSGSLLFGQVALSDVRLTRQSDQGLAFDLSVAKMEADVALWSLIGAEPRIELARVAGVSGHVTPPVQQERAAEGDERPRSARRPFRVDEADVSNVAIDIRPRDAAPYQLVIKTGQVAPFRSRMAMFDLLFRSNLEASVADQPLLVSTREISERGRETIWSFEEVEVDRLKLILPKAPLTWLSDGTLTARVEDRWDLTDEEIDMDWRIVLDDIDVTTPEGAGQAERLLAGGLAKLVQRQGGNADFRYRLELGPEEVAALRSGDLRTFWDTVLSGFLDPSTIRISAENDEGEAAEGGRVRNALESLRDRFRREGDE